jgi:hypothetical protein
MNLRLVTAKLLIVEHDSELVRWLYGFCPEPK